MWLDEVTNIIRGNALYAKRRTLKSTKFDREPVQWGKDGWYDPFS